MNINYYNSIFFYLDLKKINKYSVYLYLFIINSRQKKYLHALKNC